MKTPRSASCWVLALIVICYLVLGTLYAVLTPKWQAPDEPAHFNYIKHLAEKGRLPVLQPGDYPYQYLEEIKAAKFPPSMPISAIRYESHQPPLYYALGALVYRLTSALGADVQFLTLRLFSVLLGALVLVTAHQVVCTVFPAKPFLALAATAFIAIVPMHITFTAAINNDTLAELVLLLILWRSVRIVRTSLDARQVMITGMLLGLALLTKTTIYVSLGIVAVAVLLHPAPVGGVRSTIIRKKVSYLLCAFIPALLISAPWFARNASIYGNLDILGWQRHDTVVEGQLRTVDFLATVGPASYAKAFVFTTFRSFWGQFGWMGVLMDEWLYLALALMSGLLGLGFIAFLIRVRKAEVVLTPSERASSTVLAICALTVTMQHLWYNVKFVQHQGRYLFPALGPIGLAAALGLREMLRPRTARLLASVLLVGAVSLAAYGVLCNHVATWGLALLIAGAVFLACLAWLPRSSRLAPPALYLSFLALDWLCLSVYIVPYLQ